MWKRFSALAVFSALAFSLLYMRVFWLMNSEEITEAGSRQGSYTVSAGKTYGNIYDRNFQLLNNDSKLYLAVVNPTAENVRKILPYVTDRETFYEKLKLGKPFCCAVNGKNSADEDIPIFEVPVRSSDSRTAIHLIGYVAETGGAAGIERAYDDFLRNIVSENKVRFQVDGNGKILDGTVSDCERGKKITSGVVLALDKDIQKICERAMRDIKKGAVVVMNPENGEILASVSVPDLTISTLEISLENKNSPFLNRAFSPYCVGSAFKLVTAATALEEGISEDFTYECTGSIDVDGQIFRCHKHNGHGILNMEEAVAESCNTYFIALGQKISSENFLNKASALGFGKPSVLADSIISQKGNLQTAPELTNSAEKANLSFGQGRLTATPLQVAKMTSAIVNDGKLAEARLVLGTTADEENILPEYENQPFLNSMKPETAYCLKKFMIAANKSDSQELCRPYNTTAGGKTSTAQTGQFRDGKEIVHAWFTGFFPAEQPEYVVTVLVEDGKTGNSTAGPIFCEIAESIIRLNERKSPKS